MSLERLDIAVQAASAGAAIAESRFRTPLSVETKTTSMDLVTQADTDAQSAVVETIREHVPDEPIVGEEGDRPRSLPESATGWIVDPIDGTNNYVNGIPFFTTAVAAVVGGDCVAGALRSPVLGEEYRVGPAGAFRNDRRLEVSETQSPGEATVCPTLWWGFDERTQYGAVLERLVDSFGDIRRFGSAQLELATVAAGGIEAAVTDVAAPPWDTVAGVAMVRAAGGQVTDLDGDPWEPESTGLVASNGVIHEELLSTLAP